MQEFEVYRRCQQILVSLGGRRILLIGRDNDDVSQLMTGLLNYGIDVHALVSSKEIQVVSQYFPNRVRPFTGWQLTHKNNFFDTVVVFDVLDDFSDDCFPQILTELKRVSCSGIMLTTYSNRFHLLKRFALTHGFRRNLSSFETVEYEELEYHEGRKLIFLEPIPSLTSLTPIHKSVIAHDMGLQWGRIADANIMKYQQAVPLLTPGDTILDIGCGAGYGTAMLARQSGAKKVIGIDINPRMVEYAKRNYINDAVRIEFHLTDAANLSSIPDKSVDIVTAFDLFDSATNTRGIVAEIFRVLNIGGRIIASVRNMWRDECEDSAPLLNWEKFRDIFKNADWIIEKQQILTSGGSSKLPKASRKIHNFPPDHVCPDDETEWCILTVMKVPLSGTKKDFTSRLNPKLETNPNYHFTKWHRDYDNPALLKTMIHISSRVQDLKSLRRVAESVAELARSNSADRGGALCILAYQLLSNNAVWAECAALLEQMSAFEPDETIHARRWRISLDYVSGLLYQAHGFLSEAKEFFIRVASANVVEITPTLGTKTVQARRRIADICFGQHQDNEAKKWLIEATEEAHRLLAADWLNVYGLLSEPNSIGIREMMFITEQAELASRTIESELYNNSSNLRFKSLFWCFSEMQNNKGHLMELLWRKTRMAWLEDELANEKARSKCLEEENQQLKQTTKIRNKANKSI